MKKLALIILCMAVMVGLAGAQTYTDGTGLTGIDILGAHQNGGRGCAGCHAPHSGGLGGGGNAATGAAAMNDPNTGSNALFGQDLTPLFGAPLSFSGYAETLPDNATAYSAAGEDELRGIMMCLACHDGNLAKGGMMQGVSWEKANGLLPTGVYGPNDIPTLLGTDDNMGGSTAGYANDHPVGVAANFGRLRLGSYLTVTFNGTTVNGITPQGAYVDFATNYGYPAIAGTPWSWGFANPDGNTVANNLFVTCTTCHNQHVMYVYKAPAGKQTGSKIAGGIYPTYFFINAPYNPGSVGTTGTQASSATQFCRQCHFGEANEAYGVTSVTTAF